jgi:hypothetical protein
MTTRSELQAKTIKDLRDIATAVDIEPNGLQKAKLIDAIMGAEGFDGAAGGPPVDLPETVKKLDTATEDSETETDLSASDSEVDLTSDLESRDTSEEDSGAATETSGTESDRESDTSSDTGSDSGPGQADEMRSKDGGSGGQSRDQGRNQPRDQQGDRDDGNRSRNRNRNRECECEDADAATGAEVRAGPRGAGPDHPRGGLRGSHRDRARDAGDHHPLLVLVRHLRVRRLLVRALRVGRRDGRAVLGPSGPRVPRGASIALTRP